jgi:hypothetical protein
MEIKITDYMPAIDELDSKEILEVRDRLVTYLKTNPDFRDIDMRPNSVVGDLIMSPLAHIMAALEIGMNRITSDIDLANISQGTIYNCDFVKKYLDNFGQGQVYEYPSTGIVQLTYGDPTTKLLDYGTKFMFAGDNGSDYIYELIDVENNLTLRSPFEKVDLSNPYEKQLVKLSEDRYIVNLAVKGKAGVGINSGTVPRTDIPHPSLIGAKALGDFDRGTLPENVMELALKVQRTYYSSSLNNRSGAISFLLQTFPELRGVSSVISGDNEMTRDRQNILGVREGAIDLYVKSRTQYTVSEQLIKMVFDNDQDLWVGSTDVIEPMLWLDGIFRSGTDVSSEVKNIYGITKDDEKYPGMSCSFSKYEKLGFEIEERLTSDDVTPKNVIGGYENETVLGGGVKVSLVGQYRGSKFLNEYKRNLTLNFTEVFTDSDGISKLRAFVRDEDYTHLIMNVVFRQDETLDTHSRIDYSYDLDVGLSGIQIVLENTSGSFSQAMLSLVGTSVKMDITGRGANFIARYRYDPNYSLVDKTMSSNDVTPINTTVLTRNFLTCKVYELHVDYKKKTAQNVDLIKAKEEIVNYVNNLTYPNMYEEFTIAEILLYYGAEGVQRVRQRGQFFRTLANKYVLDVNNQLEYYEVDNPYTTTLNPPDNIPGIGARNVNYIVDAENVTFNAIHV